MKKRETFAINGETCHCVANLGRDHYFLRRWGWAISKKKKIPAKQKLSKVSITRCRNYINLGKSASSRWDLNPRPPVITTESPVAQWLEYSARSWRVMGSKPIRNS